MKIIDWCRKGNVVRFYLGNDNLEDWGGDDWSNAPYEHNAGEVLFSVESVVEVAFPVSVSVMEPGDDRKNYGGNSPFSKDDFKERKAPFLIIDHRCEYLRYGDCPKNDEHLLSVYMGDIFENINWSAYSATILK